MLVLSFAMEQVKKSAKDDLVFVEQKEMLTEKTAEAVALLKSAHVSIAPDKKDQPLHVALQCSARVEAMINKAGGKDKLLPKQREQHKSCFQLHNKLTSLLRTMKQLHVGKLIVNRCSACKKSAQRFLMSTSRPLLMIDPLMTLWLECLHLTILGLSLQQRKKSGIAKWVPVVLAVGIGIMWQVFGTLAKEAA